MAGEGIIVVMVTTSVIKKGNLNSDEAALMLKNGPSGNYYYGMS